MSASPYAYIDAQTESLLKTLRELIRFRTVNPPGAEYEGITSCLLAELRRAGFRARRWKMPKACMERSLPPELRAYPRYNVLGVRSVRGAKKTIHFNAHYDVVPVSGAWRHGDAFSGAVDRGWIYGRGTADMKGSIAALLLALRALRETGRAPLMNVEVSFTADEETDSELGTEWLVNHAPIRPDYAVVMEGGEGDRICCGHNGVVWLEVEVKGKAAHGSLPHLGVNALEKMASLVMALQTHKAELERRVFRTPAGGVMHPTLNLGGVFSAGEGGKVNTVPAFASFTIDRRVLPTERVGEVERELRTFLAEAARGIPDCRIRVRRISRNFPSYTPPEHPFFAAMADCVTQVRRRPTLFDVSRGFDDIQFFAQVLKIPTLGYGPGGDNCHAVDERASVRELLASAKIYARLLTSFAG